jgi:CSLREA domain-containing protein/uncharacterized repeat protein (TIGR01451 family)
MRSDVIKAAAFLAVLIFLPGAVGPASAPLRATFTVNTTIDDGDGDTDDGICDTGNADDGFTGLCTLRAAWQTADASAGADVIAFDLGAGIPTITLGSGLGDMTSTIDINGATGGATKVEIKGPGAGPGPGSDSGMLITAGGNSIKNLIMNSFDGSAVILSTEGGSTLEGNWIGIDQTGASAPNAAAGLLLDGSSGNMIGGTTEATRNVLDGVIFFDADANTFIGNYVGTTPDGSAATGTGGGLSFVFGAEDNVIGGSDPGAGNVISGNGGNGITIGFGSTDNLIEGNFIGTNPTGTAALGNAVDGIHISGSSDNTIRDNVISGNSSDGIELREGGAKTLITGNRIGTDITGTADLGNAEIGIRLVMAPENTIGGTTTDESNLISGNGAHGILVRGEIMEAPFPNTILGNRIGTNAAGTAALPNDGYGVAFDTTPTHILGSGVGAAPPACGGGCNLISGNGLGGVALLKDATALRVIGNHIGLTKDGTMPLPNGGPGVNIMAGNENLIEGNFIAFNAGPGVRVVEDGEDTALRNHITRNTLFENGGLGIDLGPPGITPNDGDDTDDGPNTLQNAPTITSVTQAGGSTTIEGFVKSTLLETFRVEIFANAMPDPSGAGEGQTFLGEVVVANEEVFTLTVSGLHENIAATATDGMGNTSEFSGKAGLIVNSEGDAPDADPTNGSCDTGNTIAGGAPECTLRAAIQEANAGTDDQIIFNIPGSGIGGVYTIALGSTLPTVAASITIDATSQPGFLFTPVIVINGADAFNGFRITAGGTLIKGFAFQDFEDFSIRLDGAGGNEIKFNYFGTDDTGTSTAGRSNGAGGVLIVDSPNNLIGGSPIDGNVFGGHAPPFDDDEGIGIKIIGSEATGNKIQSNRIGVGATGTALPNKRGIWIDGAPNNEIGGPTNDHRNIISGNTKEGILITGAGASGNTIWMNYIGTDPTGTSAVANGSTTQDGVVIKGAPNNEIGGNARGNLISGNGQGVRLEDAGASGNKVWGNLIGTDKDGTCIPSGTSPQCPLRNTDGVVILDAPANEIGGGGTGQRNVISGNTSSAIEIRGSDGGSVGNKIQGNYIGTDATGLAILNNGVTGINITGGTDTEVGGSLSGLGNVISGHTNGIVLHSENVTGTHIRGNYIGTHKDGTCTLEGDFPVCPFGNSHGIVMQGVEDNTVGGSGFGEGNVIAGNRTTGVELTGQSTNNRIEGNLIGVDVSGTKGLATRIGVHIHSGSTNNYVGGSAGTTPGEVCAGACNVISGQVGDGVLDGHGVLIEGDGSDGNHVQGNYIGLTQTGDAQLANEGHGIHLRGVNNTIIGGSENARNVIAGNKNGIFAEEGEGTQIQSNFIGTDRTGTAAPGNRYNGVYIKGVVGETDQDFNTIGGLRELFSEDTCGPPCNLIAGNGTEGEAGHTHGIRLEGGRATSVRGNLIGRGIGGAELGNAGHGVYMINGSGHRIGQEEQDYNPTLNGQGNVIAHNGGDGVFVEGETSIENSILSNRIFQNSGLGIDLAPDGVTPNDNPNINGDGDGGPNLLQNFPKIDTIERQDETNTRLHSALQYQPMPGTSQDFIFELFASPTGDPSGQGEGRRFIAGIERPIPENHNPQNLFGFTLDVASASIRCAFLTLTATDEEGNTSEFSVARPNLVGCLNIADVALEHALRSGFETITDGATVDGNVVKIKLDVENTGNDTFIAQVEIKERIDDLVIVRRSTDFEFPAGETTPLEFLWDTMGYAWRQHTAEPFSNRILDIRLIDPRDGATVDAAAEPITVRPRPVVLVHGLWQDHTIWSSFKQQIQNVRSDWTGYAVGDGLANGTMDTGALSVARFGVPIPLAVNAGELNIYVEGIRMQTKAAHVDLVAQGSGGLIARQYVTSHATAAQAPSDSKPVPLHLVTLGTPHLGTPCADDLFKLAKLPVKVVELILDKLTAGANGLVKVGTGVSIGKLEDVVDELARAQARNLSDLTTTYVQKTFNPEQKQQGVPFYFYGTTGFRVTCSAGVDVNQMNDFRGDAFVEIGSARASKRRISQQLFPNAPVPVKTKTESTGFHFGLPRDLTAFVFAKSVIDAFPGESASQRGDGDAAADKTEPLANATQQQQATQVMAAFPMPVPRGETTSFDLVVPDATAFGLTLVVPDAISTTLRNPTGTVVETIDGSDLASSAFRTHAVAFPEAGLWTLDLIHHGGEEDTTFVPVVAWVQGSAFQMEVQIVPPDDTGHVFLTATVTDQGAPVPDAAVVARVSPIEDGEGVTVDLFDDGQHDDGAAGDGIYGADAGLLGAATYAINTWAVAGERATSNLQFIDINTATQPTGTDLALDVTASAQQIEPNTPLTYTYTITNHGPGTATDVVLELALPDMVNFDTATTGACTHTDGIVGCTLGTLTDGATAEIAVTVTPSTGGVFLQDAAVAGAEADWNPSNNTASLSITVGTPTSTEEEAGVPRTFALHPNFPNPFNPQTTIRFDIAQTSPARLRVFNAMGQQVATLAEGTYAPGTHEVTFDASALPSGVYVYRIEAGAFQAMRTMVLLK